MSGVAGDMQALLHLVPTHEHFSGLASLVSACARVALVGAPSAKAKRDVFPHSISIACN
jgi:hypothetical protein